MKEDNKLHVHYSLANNDNDEKEKKKKRGRRRVASVAIGNKKNEGEDKKVTSVRLILTCESTLP